MPWRGTPLRGGALQENGVLPADGEENKIPNLLRLIELFAYSAVRIAEIENDILFITQARARLGWCNPAAPSLTRSGRLFPKTGSI